MRANCKIVICLAIYCSTIRAVPISSEDNPTKLKLIAHINLTRYFMCRDPQPRSYRLTDILKAGALSTSETIFPSYTVIQRCDQGTGCCTEAKVCSPVPEKIYYENVEVKVDKVIPPYASRIRTLKIQHHGGCFCEMRTTPPTVVPDPIVSFVDEAS